MALYSAVEFAKQGATGLILHYLGDEATEAEVIQLKKELEQDPGVRTVSVPGDIADPETAKKVLPVLRMPLI